MGVKARTAPRKEVVTTFDRMQKRVRGMTKGDVRSYARRRDRALGREVLS